MKIGFIGCGNMGGAIIAGLIRNGFDKAEIIAADPSPKARERIEETYGIRTTDSNREAAGDAEVLVLAVKPQFLSDVFASLRNAVGEDTLVLSIVAGKTVEVLREGLGSGTKIVRAMPNTPALIGQGITAYTAGEGVSDREKEKAVRILEAFSIAEEVPERLMNVVTSLSGSSPAYVYMFIEALADAAVLDGMPRDKAYRFAAQTVKGSAQLVLESGLHPGALKDMVTSPAGTTIEGVRVLEEKGFRGAVIDAVHACTEKAGRL